MKAFKTEPMLMMQIVGFKRCSSKQTIVSLFPSNVFWLKVEYPEPLFPRRVFAKVDILVNTGSSAL